MNDTEEQIYDEGYEAGMEAAAKICEQEARLNGGWNIAGCEVCADAIREEIKKL